MSDTQTSEIEKRFAPNVMAQACPSRSLLTHATSKWGVLVLIALSHGTMRYSELRKRIEGVSERMLADTLKKLEADGFVLRRSYNVVPPHVDYSLTEFGTGTAKHVAALATFIETELARQLVQSSDGT